MNNNENDMKRREFIKGSAIIGATAVTPGLLKDASGMISTPAARKVYRVLTADKTMVGTLPVLRAFAGDHNDYVSPYVFFDEFGPVKVNAKIKKVDKLSAAEIEKLHITEKTYSKE